MVVLRSDIDALPIKEIGEAAVKCAVCRASGTHMPAHAGSGTETE